MFTYTSHHTHLRSFLTHYKRPPACPYPSTRAYTSRRRRCFGNTRTASTKISAFTTHTMPMSPGTHHPATCIWPHVSLFHGKGVAYLHLAEFLSACDSKPAFAREVIRPCSLSLKQSLKHVPGTCLMIIRLNIKIYHPGHPSLKAFVHVLS
jgi:hypothetical protein